jgi:hypothetical protein
VKHYALVVALVIVLVLSVWSGYWGALGPFHALILYEEGFTARAISQILFDRTAMLLIAGLGGSFVLLGVSYYAGKGYRITGSSALLLLFFLAAVIVGGSFLGYVIGQQQYPEYPVLNVHFFIETLRLSSYAVWAFLGVLAGNYRRERETRAVNEGHPGPLPVGQHRDVCEEPSIGNDPRPRRLEQQRSRTPNMTRCQIRSTNPRSAHETPTGSWPIHGTTPHVSSAANR